MAVGQVDLCSSLPPLLPATEPTSDKTPNNAELDKGNYHCDHGFEENIATGLVIKYCITNEQRICIACSESLNHLMLG